VTLLVLTAIEIYLGYVHLRPLVMLTVLIGLSLVKAGLIVAYFMHMKFEKKTFIYTVVPITIVLLLLFGILFPDGKRLHDNRGVSAEVPPPAVTQ
jgi:cytochrome c oxidase subunit 4